VFSAKKSVKIIAAILKQNGVKNIIFSPGSRNAPLVIQFCEDEFFDTTAVPDERCAAFIAMGNAQWLKQPTVICCTSGTASLNYAPAIAEAYYQGIPLIVLTADRPREWIDHGEGQSIRQNNIYHNYIKGSYDLPQDINNQQQSWYCNRLCNEAYNLSMQGKKGPVHINIPFSEPLYETTKEPIPQQRHLTVLETEQRLSFKMEKDILKLWNSYDKKMILCGQMAPQDGINHILGALAERPDIAIVSESLANIDGKKVNHHIDRSITLVNDSNIEVYRPDILITMGSAIVSKKIKQLFRDNPPKEHWHIDPSGEFQDMFKCLTKIIPLETSVFLDFIDKQTESQINDFGAKWQGLFHLTGIHHESFLAQAPYSDLKAYEIVMDTIPENTNIHLANSTAVRYAQFFPIINGAKYFCNRGTSGIDGSTSTAIGSLNASKRPTVLLTGDISFFYDSNAFWNTLDKTGLKIVIFNNSGGGIFRIINGPSKTQQLEEYFETQHTLKADKIAEMYGLNYQSVNALDILENSVYNFFDPEDQTPAILEIFTDPTVNPVVLEDYFKFLKQ